MASLRDSADPACSLSFLDGVRDGAGGHDAVEEQLLPLRGHPPPHAGRRKVTDKTGCPSVSQAIAKITEPSHVPT